MQLSTLTTNSALLSYEYNTFVLPAIIPRLKSYQSNSSKYIDWPIASRGFSQTLNFHFLFSDRGFWLLPTVQKNYRLSRWQPPFSNKISGLPIQMQYKPLSREILKEVEAFRRNQMASYTHPFNGT